MADSALPWASRVWGWAASMREETGAAAGFLGLGDRMRKWGRERDGREEEDGGGGVLGDLVGQRKPLVKCAADATIFAPRQSGGVAELWVMQKFRRVQPSICNAYLPIEFTLNFF